MRKLKYFRLKVNNAKTAAERGTERIDRFPGDTKGKALTAKFAVGAALFHSAFE
ncbi:hypothetical protein [Methylocaldum sp.]|uniref:hypothetical protein n=1 Tax=Methylocaldum sp. TaxID=1969727 RepID=UPI002D4B9F56|nr:hypothetical protein [Methylocaldum sp.]HYE36043.1 hypothetical protein [Methylocaldum sp.]